MIIATHYNETFGINPSPHKNKYYYVHVCAHGAIERRYCLLSTVGMRTHIKGHLDMYAAFLIL